MHYGGYHAAEMPVHGSGSHASSLVFSGFTCGHEAQGLLVPCSPISSPPFGQPASQLTIFNLSMTVSVLFEQNMYWDAIVN